MYILYYDSAASELKLAWSLTDIVDFQTTTIQPGVPEPYLEHEIEVNSEGVFLCYTKYNDPTGSLFFGRGDVGSPFDFTELVTSTSTYDGSDFGKINLGVIENEVHIA